MAIAFVLKKEKMNGFSDFMEVKVTNDEMGSNIYVICTRVNHFFS